MQIDHSIALYKEQPVADGEMTISDMARTYGVSLRTLRFYEDKALLNPRRQGTARFYSAYDRIRLQLILKGKRLGFTLAEIFDLIASHERSGLVQTEASESADLTVSLGRAQITTQIAHLERQRAELDGAIEELKTAYLRIEEQVG